jgi:leucyl-tRNA synthetase
VMRDIGLIRNSEPVHNLFTQGMVLKDGSAMSKSKGNIVDPEEMVDKYGSDTCRLFVLFAAPPEKDMDWQESAVSGPRRFLERVYRFVTGHIDRIGEPAGVPTPGDKRALRKLHQTVRKVTADFDSRWHFNTSIAALMELMNELQALEHGLSPATRKDCSEKITLLIAPFAPYAAEELWALLGRTGPVFKQAWPEFNEDLAREESLEVPVQVNGKLRGRITVPHGTSKEGLEQAALADEKIQTFIAGKTVVKVIVVPEKLVNIVVR